MILIDLLKKVGSGAKFLVETVWQALKSAFGAKAKDISLAALESAKQLLATEVGKFIEATVRSLENSTLEGPARLAAATTEVKAYLAEQKKEMPTIWVQWAIQVILLFIRGLANAK